MLWIQWESTGSQERPFSSSQQCPYLVAIHSAFSFSVTVDERSLFYGWVVISFHLAPYPLSSYLIWHWFSLCCISQCLPVFLDHSYQCSNLSPIPLSCHLLFSSFLCRNILEQKTSPLERPPVRLLLPSLQQTSSCHACHTRWSASSPPLSRPVGVCGHTPTFTPWHALLTGPHIHLTSLPPVPLAAASRLSDL